MHIEAVELRQLDIPMVEPLIAAHGYVGSRVSILVRVITDAGDGWGECVAFHEPRYTSDWSNGEFALLTELFVPELMRPRDVVAEDVASILAPFKDHQTAKAALELAVLDAQLRAQGESMATYIGGTSSHIESAIVVGLLDADATLRSIDTHLQRGYRKLKLKIEPGRDVARIDLVRSQFPDLELRVDANGSYDWENDDHKQILRELDERGLCCIEQPLPPDSARLYIDLRRSFRTPIALDESITSYTRAMDALAAGICDIVVVKPGMVGGHLAAKRLHDECRNRGVDMMVGGFIETAVARAANLALAALPGFHGCPAEIAADGRWFHERLNVEPVTIHDGMIKVPQSPGIGVDLNLETVHRLTRRMHVSRRS